MASIAANQTTLRNGWHQLPPPPHPQKKRKKARSGWHLSPKKKMLLRNHPAKWMASITPPPAPSKTQTPKRKTKKKKKKTRIKKRPSKQNEKQNKNTSCGPMKIDAHRFSPSTPKAPAAPGTPPQPAPQAWPRSERTQTRWAQRNWAVQSCCFLDALLKKRRGVAV